MNNIKYWADHFDTQQKHHPTDAVKALNFSNFKLMNQVHEEILSCVDFSQIRHEDRLLDTGCGTGELLCKLMAQSKDPAQYQFFATDISSQMLKKARENVEQKFGAGDGCCNYSLMSVDDMQFEDDYFKLVLASESLQYTDPYSAILDLIRMTKKDGQVVISIPNHHSPFIQNARKKHDGRFTGLDFERAYDIISPKVTLFQAKPLIFAENQEEKPYLSRDFDNRLHPDDIQQANRFVLSLIV